ncbi:unnamed protein product [Meloidogyne enterolobii]|uniref:Uncharacterized protein n=1 Tax=Meloidogyne enterolobii TaxID=390850 RepID=A0ACB0Y9K7_MELEN
MQSLPTEVQLDVLKCLNFDQLISFKQTNFYFWELINRYEEELARIEFISLSIVYFDSVELDSSKFIPLKSGIFEFTLNDQLKKKWQTAIDESIPLYLHDFAYDTKYVVCLDKKRLRQISL